MFCFVHSDFEMCFAPQRRAIFNLSSGRMAPHPAALALASRLFEPPEPQIILVYWCIGRACQLLMPVLCGLIGSDSPIHQYTNYTTPQLQLQLQLQLHYTNYCTLHYSYDTITLHPAVVGEVGWGRVRWPLQPLQKTQLQPPSGPSVDSLCHPCITTTHLSYSVLSFKLPPPPRAVLLVIYCNVCMYIYIYVFTLTVYIIYIFFSTHHIPGLFLI